MCDFKSAYHTAEHSDTHYQLTKIRRTLNGVGWYWAARGYTR